MSALKNLLFHQIYCPIITDKETLVWEVLRATALQLYNEQIQGSQPGWELSSFIFMCSFNLKLQLYLQTPLCFVLLPNLPFSCLPLHPCSIPCPLSMPVPKPSSVPIPLHSGVVASRAWSHTPIQKPSWLSAYAYTWSCPCKWGPLPPQLPPISLTPLWEPSFIFQTLLLLCSPFHQHTELCQLQCFPKESVGAD